MKKNGFTLVELMIYVGVSMVIMAAVYAAVVMAMRTSSSLGRKVTTQQDARIVLDMMAMDIRDASYSRWHLAGIWRDQANNLLAVDNGLAGIQVANQNNILVEMDLNNNGIIGDPNEVISYSYDGVNTIRRSSNFGSNFDLIGGAGNGTMIRNAQVVPQVPLFTYFNGIGTDISATVVSSPTDPNLGIPAIRRIRITIVADTEANDLNTRAPKRMIYTTDVVVKNHASSINYTGGI
jgi:type II secretory pathway component PulJ